MARLTSPYDDDPEKTKEKLRKKMKNAATVKYTMLVPVFIHKKVKHKALHEGKSIKDVIMDNLLNYIKDE